MTTTNHSPTPWQLIDGIICAASGFPIADTFIFYDRSVASGGTPAENKEHIVRAVNAFDELCSALEGIAVIAEKARERLDDNSGPELRSALGDIMDCARLAIVRDIS